MDVLQLTMSLVSVYETGFVREKKTGVFFFFKTRDVINTTKTVFKVITV